MDIVANQLLNRHNYLLILNVPIFIETPTGKCFVDELLNRDLRGHHRYIPLLNYAAPRASSRSNPSGPPLEPALLGTRFIDLGPVPRSTWRALLDLPRLCFVIWREIGKASIVHSCIAGWPIPLGWIAYPIAKFRGKLSVLVVESRWQAAGPFWKKSLKQNVFELMAKLCVRLADLRFFTQPEYRDTLLTRVDPRRDLVVPATWIDSDDILSAALAEQSWAKKFQEGPRFAFFGRLAEAKGVRILFSALGQLDSLKLTLPKMLEFDVYGSGDLADECAALCQKFKNIRVQMKGVVNYGADFFAVLRDYDLVVAPTLTDEQPRIIFDAWAQAVPLLASATPGHCSLLSDGKTARLVPVGDADALAKAMAQLMQDRELCRELGLSGWKSVQSRTHDEMHRVRAEFIEAALRRHQQP